MKKQLTIEDRFKKCRRKLWAVTSILVVFVILAGVYTYLNYDYFVFKHFISSFYVYTDTLDKLFQKELGRDVKGKYYSYFDDMVISVVTRSIRDINKDGYTYLYIPEQYQKQFADEKQVASKSEAKPINDKIVYLRLTNFSPYTIKIVKDNVGILKKYPMIIIDLRDNYGGDIYAINEIAGMFLKRGNIIATDINRVFKIVNSAKTNGALKYDSITILQNRNTASSSENMIAALKDNLTNVELIGDVTFGKGIGQYTIPLKGGFAVKATTLFWYTPKGINIQGKGINPDVVYTADDILDFAVKRLMAK